MVIVIEVTIEFVFLRAVILAVLETMFNLIIGQVRIVIFQRNCGCWADSGPDPGVLCV